MKGGEEEVKFWNEFWVGVCTDACNFRAKLLREQIHEAQKPPLTLQWYARAHGIDLQRIPLKQVVEWMKTNDPWDSVTQKVSREWDLYVSLLYKHNHHLILSAESTHEPGFFDNFISRVTLAQCFDDARNKLWAIIPSDVKIRAGFEMLYLDEVNGSNSSSKRERDQRARILEHQLHELETKQRPSALANIRRYLDHCVQFVRDGLKREKEHREAQSMHRALTRFKKLLYKQALELRSDNGIRVVPEILEENFKNLQEDSRQSVQRIANESKTREGFMLELQLRKDNLLDIQEKTQKQLMQEVSNGDTSTGFRIQYYEYNHAAFRYHGLDRVCHNIAEFNTLLTNASLGKDVAIRLRSQMVEKWSRSLESLVKEANQERETMNRANSSLQQQRARRFSWALELDRTDYTLQYIQTIMNTVNSPSSNNNNKNAREWKSRVNEFIEREQKNNLYETWMVHTLAIQKDEAKHNEVCKQRAASITKAIAKILSELENDVMELDLYTTSTNQDKENEYEEVEEDLYPSMLFKNVTILKRNMLDARVHLRALHHQALASISQLPVERGNNREEDGNEKEKIQSMLRQIDVLIQASPQTPAWLHVCWKQLPTILLLHANK